MQSAAFNLSRSAKEALPERMQKFSRSIMEDRGRFSIRSDRNGRNGTRLLFCTSGFHFFILYHIGEPCVQTGLYICKSLIDIVVIIAPKIGFVVFPLPYRSPAGRQQVARSIIICQSQTDSGGAKREIDRHWFIYHSSRRIPISTLSVTHIPNAAHHV